MEVTIYVGPDFSPLTPKQRELLAWYQLRAVRGKDGQSWAAAIDASRLAELESAGQPDTAVVRSTHPYTWRQGE